jgi:hypothetical protein
MKEEPTQKNWKFSFLGAKNNFSVVQGKFMPMKGKYGIKKSVKKLNEF